VKTSDFNGCFGPFVDVKSPQKWGIRSIIMENRFATFLNRGAQALQRKSDFTDTLAVIRNVSGKNTHPETGALQTSIGLKTKDDAFTVYVQYYHGSGQVRGLRLVFPGLLAEKAVREQLNKGMKIRFTGMVAAHVDPLGQLDRRPYCVVEKYHLEKEVDSEEAGQDKEAIEGMTKIVS
jgi:hypothetical protein